MTFKFPPFKILLSSVTILFCAFIIFLFCSGHESRAETTVDPPLIRVLVAENQTGARLTIKGGYVIRALPSLQVLKKGERLVNVPVTAAASGIYLDKQGWAAKGIRVEPAKDRDLFLNRSRFRGSLDVLRTPKNTLYAVNRLPVESYLYGVVPHEVAPWWPMEALKAQAIAARTYALYQASVSRVQEYDVKSSTSSQVYGGSTTERFRANRAVDLTRGKVLTFQKKIFPAYFHATCGGTTAAAEELWKIKLTPLGGGVQCGYCRYSPHTHWQSKVPPADIEERMRKNGYPVGQILNIEPISQTPSGRVGRLRITGTTGEFIVAAKDFRIWVGGDRIRSTKFKVSMTDDVADFRGMGWGHGVGLCQWGAFGQSLLGHPFDKILSFYYPGSSVLGNYGA